MSASYLTQKELYDRNPQLTKLLYHNFVCAAEICLQNKDKLKHVKSLLLEHHKISIDIDSDISLQRESYYRFCILSLNCFVPKTVHITDIAQLQPHHIHVASILSLHKPINQEELEFALRAGKKFCVPHGNSKCSKCAAVETTK